MSEGIVLSVVIADKRADSVDMKVYQELFLIGFGFVFTAFSSERVDEFGICFFAEFGQVKSFAFVTRALFDEHISGVWIGLEIFVGETGTHDKGDCIFVGDVRSPASGAAMKKLEAMREFTNSI